MSRFRLFFLGVCIEADYIRPYKKGSPEFQKSPGYWNQENDPDEVRRANEAEWRQTIENALKEPHKGMAYRLKQILAALKSTSVVKACGGTMTMPPPLPKKLPPLIKLLTSNVPPLYKPAVASAVFLR